MWANLRFNDRSHPHQAKIKMSDVSNKVVAMAEQNTPEKQNSNEAGSKVDTTDDSASSSPSLASFDPANELGAGDLKELPTFDELSSDDIADDSAADFDFDSVLTAQDPEFAGRMNTLQVQLNEKKGETVEIPTVKQETSLALILLPVYTWVANVRSKSPNPREAFSNLNQILIGLVSFCAAKASKIKSWIFDLVQEFRTLRKWMKVQILIFTVCGIAALFVVRNLVGKSFMPLIDASYLPSASAQADASYAYDPETDLEDFETPLRQPEHIVVIDRYIVNLRQSENASTTMAMIELYVEATTKDGAVELKDREKEVRDLISRTTELFGYDELLTVEGKEKLKRSIKKRLNEDLMTSGKVRTVYFKNVIFKP
jgi:flagellar basal body-associated protein FliL